MTEPGMTTPEELWRDCRLTVRPSVNGVAPAMTEIERHPRRDRRRRTAARSSAPFRSRPRTGARSCGPTSRRCSPACRRRRRTRGSRCTSTRCPLPELAPDEALVAVMASSINFNTVWTSIFEPVPTFGFLQRLGRESVWGARHDQPFHVVGSDAAGVVLRVGSAVRMWKPGDAVTVHCNHVDDQDPSAHDDSMLATNQRIWGYETNYGGLGEVTLVKANQLMPKPAHLTWEEAAVQRADQLDSYRMLVSPNGAQMTQGQTVLDLGRQRRDRRVRVPVRAQRRRHAGRRGVEPRARRAAPRPGRRARHRPHGRGLPVLEGRAHAGSRASGAAWASASASSSAATPTSCSSTRAGRRWAHRCSCARGAAPSSRARPRAAS